MRTVIGQFLLLSVAVGVPHIAGAQGYPAKVGPDPQVIGHLPSTEAAAVLDGMGDKATAETIRATVDKTGADVEFSELALAAPKPYQYTDHVFGFIPQADAAKSAMVDLTDAGNIHPDQSLKNASIKVTLDRLRIFDYPGGGIHQVLFDFFADHQATDTHEEELHFNQIYRVSEGGGAGITGYPVFLGLRVGEQGVKFQCSTVNVGNEGDQKFLGFLDGDVFKGGLKLLNAVNPVVPVITNVATGIARGIASRSNNIKVQEFYMGLDFAGNQTRAKLRQGSYVAVQVPDAAKWNWSEWQFNPSNGQLVSKADPTLGIPYNYVVFSLSKM